VNSTERDVEEGERVRKEKKEDIPEEDNQSEAVSSVTKSIKQSIPARRLYEKEKIRARMTMTKSRPGQGFYEGKGNQSCVGSLGKEDARGEEGPGPVSIGKKSDARDRKKTSPRLAKIGSIRSNKLPNENTLSKGRAWQKKSAKTDKKRSKEKSESE